MKIEDYPDVLEIINAILNNKGVAEIKIERGDRLTVVEIKRTLKGEIDVFHADRRVKHV